MSAAELRALRAELEALRLTVASQGERISELEAKTETGAEGSDHFFFFFSLPEEALASEGLVSSTDRQGRERLAKECGQFLKRAVRGVFRGCSGREKLKLANRIYVVLVNFEGQRLPGPKVTENFAEVKEICKRGSSAGASVFLGFPTLWEARIAVEEAGYTWPLSH